MACVRLQHRMLLRAWRFTAPTSRTQPSVGKEWLVLYGQPSKRLAAFQWATETGSRHPPSPRRRRTRLYTRLLRRLTEHGHPSIHRGYPRRDLPGTVGQDDRLARPCPPPQLTCKPLKIRKDVRPAEQGRVKVEPGRRCPVRTRFDRPENNLTPR